MFLASPMCNSCVIVPEKSDFLPWILSSSLSITDAKLIRKLWSKSLGVEVDKDGLLWCWIGSFSEYNDFVSEMNKKD